jgi:KaiC/GvpD/RAD55 family RecA-like ATPase
MLPLVDVRDDEALSATLSQVFLFVEQMNANAGLEVRKFLQQKLQMRNSATERLRTEDLIKSVARVDLDFKNIILQLLRWLIKEGRWSKRSLFLELAHRTGLQPSIDRRVLEALVGLLVSPARLVPKDDEKIWLIQGQKTSLPRPAGIDVLFEHLWLYRSAQGPLFATQPLLDHSCAIIPEIPVYYWEEPFDPIGIVRLFISEVLGETGRAADHYLQKWLRYTFNLGCYDKGHKYALAAICESFNNLFYGASVPSTQIVHNHRTPTVSASLLISQLAEVLRRAAEGRGHILDSDQIHLRQALGLYCFLHFCRQLRRRTFWPNLEKAREQFLSEDNFRDLAQVGGQQCVSSLRPLGYTYFQSRMFGFISSIPGLSNVFRGGLLPRTDSGRAIALVGPAGIGKTVLALQVMTDFARFGGLAIYLSLEESYDSILDRLVTFGLWDRSKFQVKQAGQDLPEVIQEAIVHDPKKGLLIFYQPGIGASSTLPQVILSLGQATEAWPSDKGLVIDSVNSLQFPSRPQSSEVEDSRSRSYLYDAIAQIERCHFFGILLGEKDGRFYRILPYLADTVIEMGSDEDAHTRWLEIKKCRVQDYHEGKHPFRVLDGRGVIIYPSLASRRASLRGRIRSTLSQRWVIPYPGATSGFEGIPEKSSTLIWGPQGSGKTLVALKLLTAASTLKGELDRADFLLPPQNIVVISFRTSEKNFEQAIERQSVLGANWSRIRMKWLRWYSPGSNLTAEQILSEIWRYINESRRRGVPVDRIIFDETEVAQDIFPALRRDPLFWPSILELASTEAATSFFICGTSDEDSSVMKILQGSMDNSLHVYETAEHGKRLRCVDLVRHTELVPGSQRISEELVSSEGELRPTVLGEEGRSGSAAPGFEQEPSSLASLGQSSDVGKLES